MFYRLTRLLLLLLLFAVLSFPPRLRGQPSLEFSPKTFEGGSTISFKADFVDDARPSVAPTSVAEATTADHRFTLSSDLSQTSFTGIIYYTFDSYLRDMVDGAWWHYKVIAQPKGAFADTLARVDFTIRKDFHTSTGYIDQLPVYNFLYGSPASPSFVSEQNGKPQPVQLLAPTPLRFTVTSQLHLLPIRVEPYFEPSHRDYWKTAPLPNTRYIDIQPTPGSGNFEVTATPQMLPALIASIFNHDAEHGDETITLEGKYQSLPGGPIRSLNKFVVPVCFIPSGPTLSLALFFGLALGMLGVAMLSQPARTGLGRCCVAAMIVAVVVELIGIGIVQAHSSFQLFGISLDPITVQGSFLVGLGVGVVCIRRSTYITDIIDKATFVKDRSEGHSLCIGLIALVLMCCSPLRAASLPFQPVGITGGLKSQGLFVLASGGNVFAITSDGDHWKASVICQVVTSGELLDLTRVMSNGIESIVTIQFVPAALVTQYSLCRPGAAKSQSLMVRDGVFNGVAGDPTSSTIWISNSSTREIYSYVNQKTSFLAGIGAAATITALAYDAVRGVLYAGDAVAGDLFVVKLGSKQSLRVASDLGQIRAVVPDPIRHRILVVDSAREKIWSVADSGLVAKPQEFYRFPKKADPCGIAIQYERVWVTDCSSKQIYSISFGGSLIEPDIRFATGW